MCTPATGLPVHTAGALWLRGARAWQLCQDEWAQVLTPCEHLPRTLHPLCLGNAVVTAPQVLQIAPYRTLWKLSPPVPTPQVPRPSSAPGQMPNPTLQVQSPGGPAEPLVLGTSWGFLLPCETSCEICLPPTFPLPLSFHPRATSLCSSSHRLSLPPPIFIPGLGNRFPCGLSQGRSGIRACDPREAEIRRIPA